MKLLIPLEIWQEIQCYAKLAAPDEITGFGTIQQVGTDFVVDEIFVPQQMTSATYCETVEGALNNLIFDLIEDDPTRVGSLRFRWHSHVNGNVYWSSIDEKDITAWQAPWVVNLVANVRGEKKARLDVHMDELLIRNLELETEIVLPDVTPEIFATCAQEVCDKLNPMRHTRKFYEMFHKIFPFGQDIFPLGKGGDKNEPQDG